jgi:hypothetical protein
MVAAWKQTSNKYVAAVNSQLKEEVRGGNEVLLAGWLLVELCMMMGKHSIAYFAG